MAGRAAMMAECRRLNQDRRVQVQSSCSAEEFWSFAQGTFVLAGGSQETRRRMLCEKLSREMELGTEPTFLLTTSWSTELEMIRRVRNGETGGRLCVTSSRYPNYLFFQGWSRQTISRFLMETASTLHYDVGSMPVYIEAFTRILSRHYEPNLSAMQALAEYSDDEIAEIGREDRVEESYLNHIRSCAVEGKNFRQMLEQMTDVFSPLAAEEPEAGYSLASVPAEAGQLYILDLSSHEQTLMNAYFAEELAVVLARRSARVVLEDMPIEKGDRLEQVVGQQKSRGREISLSAENPALLPETLLRGFKALALLLDGTIPSGDMLCVLERLGTYTHHEAVLAVPPAMPLTIKPRGYVIHPEPGRLRVRPEDTSGFSAVLFGMSGNDIVLARSLR